MGSTCDIETVGWGKRQNEKYYVSYFETVILGHRINNKGIQGSVTKVVSVQGWMENFGDRHRGRSFLCEISVAVGWGCTSGSLLLCSSYEEYTHKIPPPCLISIAPGHKRLHFDSDCFCPKDICMWDSVIAYFPERIVDNLGSICEDCVQGNGWWDDVENSSWISVIHKFQNNLPLLRPLLIPMSPDWPSPLHLRPQVQHLTHYVVIYLIFQIAL